MGKMLPQPRREINKILKKIKEKKTEEVMETKKPRATTKDPT